MGMQLQFVFKRLNVAAHVQQIATGGGHEIEHGGFEVFGLFLLDIIYATGFGADDTAPVEIHAAGHDFEKGRLAAAVASYQADPVSRLHREGNIVQDNLIIEFLEESLGRQQGHD
jgi:hypothetical protein